MSILMLTEDCGYANTCFYACDKTVVGNSQGTIKCSFKLGDKSYPDCR